MQCSLVLCLAEEQQTHCKKNAYRDKKKKSYMFFVDIEWPFDKVSRKVRKKDLLN